MDRQYKNGLAPELLAILDQSPFTAEQLAGMNDETRARISEQQEYCRQHPSTLYRPDNRDKIISTLCDGPMIVGREGEAMPKDFLLSAEVA